MCHFVKCNSVEYHAVEHGHSTECHSAKRDSVYAVLLSYILTNVRVFLSKPKLKIAFLSFCLLKICLSQSDNYLKLNLQKLTLMSPLVL